MTIEIEQFYLSDNRRGPKIELSLINIQTISTTFNRIEVNIDSNENTTVIILRSILDNKCHYTLMIS